MPVEECGNMLVMETNVALATKSTAFAESHIEILEKWCKYLIEFVFTEKRNKHPIKFLLEKILLSTTIYVDIQCLYRSLLYNFIFLKHND